MLLLNAGTYNKKKTCEIMKHNNVGEQTSKTYNTRAKEKRLSDSLVDTLQQSNLFCLLFM